METKINIANIINSEKYNFDNKQVQVVPGFYFNQKDTIELIYLYYNSKFKTGDIDADGDKKYFYNIVKNPCKVCSKAIDFDTKDIRLYTAPGGNQTKTWWFDRDLKQWMEEHQFGKVLNRIFKELPIFGSVVLKVINGIPYFVDLRNFIVSQSADNLDSSSYVTEVHRYTVPQFRKAAKEFGWKEVEKAIEEFRKMKDATYIEVYERYGEVEEMDEKGNKSYPYKRVFYADVGIDEYDQQTNKVITKSGVVLKEDEIDEHPYWEFHLDKLPGRWLGLGVIESLIDPQIRQNEIANLQAKGSYWRAIMLFQTRDQGAQRNLKTDVSDGELIQNESEITKIDMTDTNLAFFNEETNKWIRNRDELTFSYDVVQGERLPAGTPLGSAQIATASAMSYFDVIREDVAMDIKELIYKVVIPSFKKEATKEHTIRLMGEDLDTYFKMVKNILVNDEIIRLVIKSMKGNGKFPTEQDRDVISALVEESFKQNKEKMIKIPENFYKDVKYSVRIDITGESRDTRITSATKFAALQAVTVDPTLLTDPTKKKFFYSWLEDGGLNPNDFISEIEKKDTMETITQLQGQKGGGVSRPMIPQSPMAGTATQTL